MTATHRSRSHQQPLVRRLKITFAALALSALGVCCFGAPASQAVTGTVYTDGLLNAAAGEPSGLFNGTFTGSDNVGLGPEVMTSLTTGSQNLAIGSGPLRVNTTGLGNVATGWDTLYNNTTGNSNVATGAAALMANATGNNNVAVGRNALGLATGDGNIALGFQAGLNHTTGSNNIDIGNAGKAGESKTIRIGTAADHKATFVAGISGKSVSANSQQVFVSANGKLGTAPGTSRTTGDLGALIDTVQRQERALKRAQRQIARLQAQVRGG